MASSRAFYGARFAALLFLPCFWLGPISSPITFCKSTSCAMCNFPILIYLLSWYRNFLWRRHVELLLRCSVLLLFGVRIFLLIIAFLHRPPTTFHDEQFACDLLEVNGHGEPFRFVLMTTFIFAGSLYFSVPCLKVLYGMAEKRRPSLIVEKEKIYSSGTFNF